jgi:hypothetical protein
LGLIDWYLRYQRLNEEMDWHRLRHPPTLGTLTGPTPVTVATAAPTAPVTVGGCTPSVANAESLTEVSVCMTASLTEMSVTGRGLGSEGTGAGGFTAVGARVVGVVSGFGGTSKRLLTFPFESVSVFSLREVTHWPSTMYLKRIFDPQGNFSVVENDPSHD